MCFYTKKVASRYGLRLLPRPPCRRRWASSVAQPWFPITFPWHWGGADYIFVVTTLAVIQQDFQWSAAVTDSAKLASVLTGFKKVDNMRESRGSGACFSYLLASPNAWFLFYLCFCFCLCSAFAFDSVCVSADGVLLHTKKHGLQIWTLTASAATMWRSAGRPSVA